MNFSHCKTNIDSPTKRKDELMYKMSKGWIAKLILTDRPKGKMNSWTKCQKMNSNWNSKYLTFLDHVTFLFWPRITRNFFVLTTWHLYFEHETFIFWSREIYALTNWRFYLVKLHIYLKRLVIFDKVTFLFWALLLAKWHFCVDHVTCPRWFGWCWRERGRTQTPAVKDK